MGIANRVSRMRRARVAFAAVIAVCALVAAAAPAPASAQTSQFTYVPMPDGVRIAVNVVFPDGCGATKQCPVLFNMDGYGGAGNHDDGEFDNTTTYIVVYASVRGSGCSGGTFDLFSPQIAADGRSIIDDWVPSQPWGHYGTVGIFGHSYSALTGLAVAEAQPPAGKTDNLGAVAVSGLVDDLYRGEVYMGGIQNPGFPVAWGQAIRPESEFADNSSNLSKDSECRQHQVDHQGSDAVYSPQNGVGIYANFEATDDSWLIQHSLFRHLDRVDQPTWIAQQYQDEQTGPRGGIWLWEHLNNGVPKRLMATNGTHDTNDRFDADRANWLDCWLVLHGTGCKNDTADPAKRVHLYFETTGSMDDTSTQVLRPPYVTSDYPAPETDWQRDFLRADGTLAAGDPGADGSVAYASTTQGRQSTNDVGFGVSDGNQGIGRVTLKDGPDQAVWTRPFDQATAIAGPIDLTLWATSTAPDTDLFVDVMDRDTATGDLTYVQRGLLRASFRATDDTKADRVASGPLAGTVYRPYHPFVGSQLLTPGQAYRYDIEIYPLGHVFRAGHELVLAVHAPPLSDPLSTDGWNSHQAPAVNTILQDAQHRSSVLLPVLPTVPPLAASPPGCGDLTGEPCVSPAG